MYCIVWSFPANSTQTPGAHDLAVWRVSGKIDRYRWPSTSSSPAADGTHGMILSTQVGQGVQGTLRHCPA